MSPALQMTILIAFFPFLSFDHILQVTFPDSLKQTASDQVKGLLSNFIPQNAQSPRLPSSQRSELHFHL